MSHNVSKSEEDINNVFDSIALSEERLSKEGFQEGVNKGTKEGEIDGYHMGYHRGAELGAELGYYNGLLKTLLSIAEEESKPLPDKVILDINQVLELIKSFPKTNMEDVDIIKLHSDIKSKYRRICSLLKIDEEVDAVKKTALRARVNDYTRRAEELKSLLYGDSVSKSKVGQSTVAKIGITNNYTELYNQATSTPKLASGLEIGSVAEQYMAEGQYKAALEKFQGSLGVLVPLLSSEPKGRRRDLLHQQIQLWLVQAENTKSLLSLTDMNGANIAEGKDGCRIH